MINSNPISLALKTSLYPELLQADFKSQLSVGLSLGSSVLPFYKCRTNTIKRKGSMGKEQGKVRKKTINTSKCS